MLRGNGDPEYRRRIREKAEKDQHSTQAKERESAEKRNRDDVSSAIQRIEQELRRTNDEHTPQKNRDRYWERFGFLGLWFAGLVGVVAILVATYDAEKQRGVMQGQLTEMATQRLFTIAQTRANLRRESPSIIPINSFGKPSEARDKIGRMESDSELEKCWKY
jgi:hypothetical protein